MVLSPFTSSGVGNIAYAIAVVGELKIHITGTALRRAGIARCGIKSSGVVFCLDPRGNTNRSRRLWKICRTKDQIIEVNVTGFEENADGMVASRHHNSRW